MARHVFARFTLCRNFNPQLTRLRHCVESKRERDKEPEERGNQTHLHYVATKKRIRNHSSLYQLPDFHRSSLAIASATRLVILVSRDMVARSSV